MKNQNAASGLLLKFLLAVIGLLVCFFLALLLGAEKISPAALFGKGSRFETIILRDLRLPRALLVFISGILLGGSGAVFQMFFRNPLAEPGIMGISSGATLGAVIASVFGAGFAMNVCAFAGAMISGLLVTFIAFSKAGKNSSVMLLLCGTALGTLYSAVSSIILLTSKKDLYSVYSWIMGSFNGRGWHDFLFILVPSVFALVIMILISARLDLLSGGEGVAQSLGLEVNKLRIWVLICGSLAVSSAVCAGGTISFVGLIAPHIVRKTCGSKGRILIPFSMIGGAILLLLADLLARIVIAPSELPAGVITSILGVPFFIALCVR